MSDSAYSKCFVPAFKRGTQEMQKQVELNGDVAASFNLCSKTLDPKRMG